MYAESQSSREEQGESTPLSPFAEGVIHWRVLPTDLEESGRMGRAMQLRMMGVGRRDFLIRVGLLTKETEQGWRVAPGGEWLEELGTLRLMERYEIRTRLVWWDTQCFYFLHELRKPDMGGRRAARGYVRLMFGGAARHVAPESVLKMVLGRRAVRPPPPAEPMAWFGQVAQLEPTVLDRRFSPVRRRG